MLANESRQILDRQQPFSGGQRTTHRFSNWLLHDGVGARHTTTVFPQYDPVNQLNAGVVRQAVYLVAPSAPTPASAATTAAVAAATVAAARGAPATAVVMAIPFAYRDHDHDQNANPNQPSSGRE